MAAPLLALGLAPTLVVATLALQLRATLPSHAALVAAAAAAGLATLAAGRARRRGAPGAEAWLLVAIACAAWASAGARAERRVDDRLAPALEGVALRATGIVDALPTRSGEGVRLVLRVERCDRVARAADASAQERGSADADARSDDDPRPAGEDGTGDPAALADRHERDDPAARGCRLPTRVLVSSRGAAAASTGDAPDEPRAGERWAFELRAKRPHAPVNFGAFDRELRWLEEGIGGVATARRGERLDADAGGPLDAVERLRGTVRDAMLAALGGGGTREAGLLVALAIGDQASVSPASWALFNRTGISHLVSVSGLHVTMFAGLAGAGAALAWRRGAMRVRPCAALVPARLAGLAVACVVAIGYALLAGWGIPAQRTCLMLCTGALLLAGRRTPSVAHALAAAAVVVVAFDPWAPLAAGFWLSFGAVAAIAWAALGERRTARGGRTRFAGLASAARTQWAATVALLPLGAAFFGTVSLVGPLANAFAIPVVAGVVTPLAIVGGLVAPLWPSLAAWVLAPGGALLRVLLAALEALDALPWAALALPPPDALALASGCMAAALVLAPRGVPHRGLAALGLVPLLAAPLPRPGSGELRLTALDVGQGTAAVVQVGDRALLYDAGPTLGSAGDAGSRVVLPWLRGQGIARLDAMVVSHGDDDHAGGAASVLAGVPVARLATSVPDDHPLWRAAAAVERCRRGEGWRWGEVAFDWLHPADPPEPARGSATNATSCVLRVRSPAGTLLLTGDIEAAQERRLVALLGADGLAADVLLVPHHGSRTSSTETFLDAVAPRLAIAQMAYRSRHGHPHPTVVARYDARDVPLARSDADGAVQVRLVPGTPPTVIRARVAPGRYWRVPVRPP